MKKLFTLSFTILSLLLMTQAALAEPAEAITKVCPQTEILIPLRMVFDVDGKVVADSTTVLYGQYEVTPEFKQRLINAIRDGVFIFRPDSAHLGICHHAMRHITYRFDTRNMGETQPVPPAKLRHLDIALPVTITVGVNGRVSAAHVTSSDPTLGTIFERDVAQMVRQWIWKPMLDDNNKPVVSQVVWTLVYRPTRANWPSN